MGVFSAKHMLVLSVAVNCGLMLKLFQDLSGKGVGGGACRVSSLYPSSSSMADLGCGGLRTEAHVSEMTRVPRLTATSYSSSSIDDNGTEMDVPLPSNTVINLDHGDPTMYEMFWKQKEMNEKTTVVISGWQYISYFSDPRNLCWFLEPGFARAVTRLHNVVGNAVAKDHHIVVGTGSSQLFHALLYALSPPDALEPMNVVSAAPFYSSYPLMTDYLKSGLYKWAGDAHKFDKEEPYIELVTSPNNPDGSIRQAVVNGGKGILVHDLAYYWPQYTPITYPANHDIMLFTVSKSTGHAGTRIGWALVKDEEVAKRMTTFIEINTIGVSKDSQIRAAKILEAVSDSCEENQGFFEYSYNMMQKRWKQLIEAVNTSKLFSLPDFSPGTCNFSGRTFEHQPAFAWLHCKGDIEDCETFLRGHNILTRGGKQFGVSQKYVRISMLSRDRDFDLFTKRLAAIDY